MGVIRWGDYSEFGDGIWGYLGSDIVCAIKATKVGSLECEMLKIQDACPGKHAAKFRARPEDYMRVEWMPPARGHIPPVQEVMAFMMAVQAGFTSREQVAAEFGSSATTSRKSLCRMRRAPRELRASSAL
ncbi:hypothetical protein [Rhizobium sp. BK176]|uniref:hypothetical protein n=1 Tax=Rhizobium sp. BK176 TaxID=2587071 RepID=UPI0021693D44|nr:hypothetical protein [Rhizobium sp. BK176]MCS4092625.1 hypothetical protein [Rhizobium sp. BK176]